jgi:hypothetical protein
VSQATDMEKVASKHNVTRVVKWVQIESCKDKEKSKAIPVTGREDPEGCETSRLSHFLDNRLTDGGEVVSPRAGRPSPPRKIPGTHFR